MASDGQELTTEQYQQLITRGSDIITIVDADGTIIYQSPQSHEVKGWTAEEMVGDDILGYVHPDDRERVEEKFRDLVTESGRIERKAEFRFDHKTEGWIWLEVTGTAPESNSIDGYITASRDVTDRKERERNLELLNKIVRHDIRNKLQVILGAGQMLEAHVDKQGQESLSRLLASAREAVEITDTARDVAEVVLRTGTEPRPVELAPVLTDEVDEIRSYHEDAVVQLEGPLPDVVVRADDLLPAVFRNLLTNAIEHNDKELPQVTVSVDEHPEHIVVRVADNGPGVPEASREEIFEEGETGLGSDGTGIGLYLVATLVEDYGGTVYVEDNDPTGSVFVVELQKANGA